jgi:hypothetical protein
MPEILSMIQVKKMTPAPAVLVVVILLKKKQKKIFKKNIFRKKIKKIILFLFKKILSFF